MSFVPVGKPGGIVWELSNAIPHLLSGSAKGIKDFVQLVNLGITREQRGPHNHFCEDAADGPNINGCGIFSGTKQDFGGPVPQGDDLVCIVSNGNTESPCETKVGELEHARTVDEKVLRLEIAMQDSARVAIGDSIDQLVEIGLDKGRAQGTDRVHEALEVLVEVFENKVEFLVGVDYILEKDDIRMSKLFQNGNLADGGRWDACSRKQNKEKRKKEAQSVGGAKRSRRVRKSARGWKYNGKTCTRYAENKPSSSCSKRIFLRAIIWPVASSRAL